MKPPSLKQFWPFLAYLPLLYAAATREMVSRFLMSNPFVQNGMVVVFIIHIIGFLLLLRKETKLTIILALVCCFPLLMYPVVIPFLGTIIGGY